MPSVVGMGGNAGAQVLALMVRGLALGQVGASNVRTPLWKELRVSALNGLVLGSVLGIIAWWWFGSLLLSLVISAAMTIILVESAVVGVPVSLTLTSLGFYQPIFRRTLLTPVHHVIAYYC